MFDVACGGSEVLKVIKFIWTLLETIFLLVPIVLIVMIGVDLAKCVIAGKMDDMKKNLGVVIKRLIFCVALFLVEPICGFAIGLLGDTVDVDWAKCIDVAIKEDDFSDYEVEFDEEDYGNDPIIVDE